MVKKRAEKMDRFAQHSKELVKQIEAWLELRVRLAGLQYWNYLLQKRNAIYVVLGSVVASIFTVLFLLVAAAFALGILFGHMIWGFTFIGIIMGLSTWILYRLSIKMTNENLNETDRTESEINGQVESKPESNE